MKNRTTKKYNPLICAIDTPDLKQAVKLAKSLKGNVGAIKLGLEFFTANGAAGVEQIAATGSPIFLDLKFHDIPNTVAGAIKAAVALDVFMLTIHTSGGVDMMRRAVEAAKEMADKKRKEPPLIIGVTVLTSMDQRDIEKVGVLHSLPTHVLRLAELAKKCKLDGVVCSSQEIETLRMYCGKKFKLVVPGIRPANAAKGDQKRVMTPSEALAEGADYLVVGRPITQAKNPAAAAREMLL